MRVFNRMFSLRVFMSYFFPVSCNNSLYKIPAVTMSDGKEVAVLSKRLAKAEKKLHVLTLEINDIKSKINTLQQGSNTPSLTSVRKFSTNVVDSFDDFEGGPKKRLKVDFPTDDGYVVVYTDGACENNGRVGAKAGIGVWFGDNHPLNVAEPVVGRATNNTAEIQACVRAIKIAVENGVKKLCIKTDSQFVISSMTQWIKRWKKNNWKVASGAAVKNKEDFVVLDEYCQKVNDLKWIHINGHCGILGNEEADKLARSGALRYKP